MDTSKCDLTGEGICVVLGHGSDEPELRSASEDKHYWMMFSLTGTLVAEGLEVGLDGIK